MTVLRERELTISAVAILMLGGVIVLGGCESAAQRRALENAAIRKEAAREVERICSLPHAERHVELRKLENESGMVLFCGQSGAPERKD